MTSKNYPHPVLSPHTDDFNIKKATFDIQISQKIDNDNYQLICSASLKESNLENLLNDNKVSFIVKIDCSTTRYRKIFQFRNPVEIITIPSSLLENKVEITTFIIATCQINAYSSVSFNKIYGDAFFTIFPGDILAVGSEYSFNVEKEIDPLVKVPSIFTIVLSEGKKAQPIDIDSSSHKIIVRLNKESFEKYKLLRGLQNQYSNLAALTSSLFILPVLIEVIDNLINDLKNLGDDYESVNEYLKEKESSHRWFKIVNAKLQDNGIRLSDPDSITDTSIVIVQKLLGDPLSNGLLFFDDFFSNFTNSEEDEI